MAGLVVVAARGVARFQEFLEALEARSRLADQRLGRLDHGGGRGELGLLLGRIEARQQQRDKGPAVEVRLHRLIDPGQDFSDIRTGRGERAEIRPGFRHHQR